MESRSSDLAGWLKRVYTKNPGLVRKIPADRDDRSADPTDRDQVTFADRHVHDFTTGAGGIRTNMARVWIG